MRNTEGGSRCFSHAQAAAGGMGPGKEREDSSGRAGIVTKVEVVGSGIIKIDGAFDETKSHHFRVEVKIALRVGSNGCYVMQANDGFWHNSV